MKALLLTIFFCLPWTWSSAQKNHVIYRNGVGVDSVRKGSKETKLESIALLDEDSKLQEATSTEELTAVIDKITKVFDELFKTSAAAGKLMVQVELVETGKPNIQFAVRDNLDLEKMKVFEQRVLSLNYPNTKKHSVTFQLVYKVNSFDDES